MAATEASPEDFLKLYQTQRESLLQQKPATSVWQYKETVITTWEMSFSAISKQNASVAALLLFLGYMQPDDIWSEIFSLGICKKGRRRPVWENFWKATRRRRDKMRAALKFRSGKCPDGAPSVFRSIQWLEDLISDTKTFKSAISNLTDYSLVQENQLKDGISMHTLVHEWCRHRAVATRQILSTDFVILMGRVLDRELGEPSSVPIIRRIKPHISSLMDTIRQLENDTSAKEAFTVDICYALESIGHFLNSRYSDHDYEDAYYVYRISLDKSTQFLGSENQLVFALIGELSLVLEGLERFDEAIPLAEQRVALSSGFRSHYQAGLRYFGEFTAHRPP